MLTVHQVVQEGNSDEPATGSHEEQRPALLRSNRWAVIAEIAKKVIPDRKVSEYTTHCICLLFLLQTAGHNIIQVIMLCLIGESLFWPVGLMTLLHLHWRVFGCHSDSFSEQLPAHSSSFICWICHKIMRNQASAGQLVVSQLSYWKWETVWIQYSNNTCSLFDFKSSVVV